MSGSARASKLALLRLAVTCGCLLRACGGFRIATRYVLISSPSTSNIYYAHAQTFYEHTLPHDERPVATAQVLIDGKASRCKGYGCFEGTGEGLESPGALAVHEGDDGAVLYVADEAAKNIYAYNVFRSSFDWLDVSPQRRLRKGVVAKGLAVSSKGDLYYTTAGGGIEVLTADELARFAAINLRPTVGKMMSSLEPKPVTILGIDRGPALASPMGLAADSFFLYWTTLPADSSTGILNRAPQRASADAAIAGLVGGGGEEAQIQANDVCVARDNVFFTGGPRALYAVKMHGGVIAEVYANFSEPKGCAFDQDGTLYVADARENAVYSVPASLDYLRPIKYASKAIDVKAPGSVAILRSSRLLRGGAAPRRLSAPLGVLVLAALLSRA